MQKKLKLMLKNIFKLLYFGKIEVWDLLEKRLPSGGLAIPEKWEISIKKKYYPININGMSLEEPIYRIEARGGQKWNMIIDITYKVVDYKEGMIELMPIIIVQGIGNVDALFEIFLSLLSS